MTRHLLAGAAAVVMMSGIAYAQTYPPYPPAPPGAPMPVVPTAPVPPAASTSTTTTTTVAPTPDGSYRASTIKKGVDINGNEVTEKNTYKSGIEGSTETHTKMKTDPYGGITTTRPTTTTPQ